MASVGRWRVRAGVVLALGAYWVVQLRQLAVVPRAYEDEAWIASTSWKLATTGVFGSDIQGSFFGMAEHYFGFMPLYPLLQALVFKAAGLGLWQARLTSVYLGLLVLALTFAFGRRLFGGPVGLLAVLGLLLTRTAGLTLYRPSGILLLDLARLGRYDIAVPVFGLAAGLALMRATGRRAGWWAALAGALGGLAGLAHVYGWFWLPALAAALAHTGRRHAGRLSAPQGLAALLLGAGLVLAPYALYVLSGWADWLGQMAEYRDRVTPLQGAWYVNNLLTEAQRFGPGVVLADWRTWLRPGLWLVAAIGPVAGVTLVRRAGRSLPAAVVGWALGLLPVLLAVFVSSKVANYLLLYLPVASVAVAWGVAAAWRAARARGWRWLPALLALVCAAVALEGVGQWRQQWQLAAQVTPYARYVAQVRAVAEAAAPEPAAAVLGLHTYWFGFSDRLFTSWYYPVALAQSPIPGRAVPLAATLARLAPAIVLVDARMHTYLTGSATDATPGVINAWLAADYALVGTVDDATYGRTEVYRRTAP